MVVKFVTLVIITYDSLSAFTLSSESKVTLISRPIGDYILLPCGSSNEGHRVYEWFENMNLIEFPSERVSSYPNGTIGFKLRMEDADIIYGCRTYVDTTPSPVQSFVYGFAPIVSAFLERVVQNVTLDWGSVYIFPCVFAGTAPREDTMILNGKIVNETQHNITTDSVVECRVKNSLNTEHRVAYIKIRKGSKAWAIKHGVTSPRSYCQPYLSALPQSSSCLPYLQSLTNDKKSYLIANSRLMSVGQVEQSLSNLFTKWNNLLFNYRNLTVNKSSNRSDLLLHIHNNAFSSWRCVDWAKRLVCALVYPRCELVEYDTPDLDVPPRMFNEYPVCQKHCLAVTGLMCLHLLNNTQNVSTLGDFIHDPSSDKAFLRGKYRTETGWSQLISVPEVRDPHLPIDLVSPHGNTTIDDHMTDVCALQLAQIRPLSTPIHDSQTSCTQLPLETVSNSISSDVSMFDKQKLDDCIIDDGQNYHGSITMPGCLPWAILNTKSTSLTNTQDKSIHMWPGLAALNSFTFPIALNDEASSSAVCRNPAGLASYPFCIRPSNQVHNNGQSNISNVTNLKQQNLFGFDWHFVICDTIPHCPSHSQKHLNKTIEKDYTGMIELDSLSKARINTIVACSIAGVVICLLIVILLVLRPTRCDFTNLSVDFTDFVADENVIKTGCQSELTMDEKNQFPINSHINGNGDEIEMERRYLVYRRQLIQRRRRARQMNPCFQLLFNVYYYLVDLFNCHSVGGSRRSHSMNFIILNQSKNNVTSNSSMKLRDNACRGNRLPLLLCCKKFRISNKKKNRSMHNYTRNPLTDRNVQIINQDLDDEYEANTLGMQIDKSVAYVANQMLVYPLPACNQTSTLPPSKTAGHQTGESACVSCGLVADNSASTVCTKCRDGMSSETLHQMTHSHISATLEEVNQLRFEANCVNPQNTLALTESSVQLLSSGSVELGSIILPDKLFNLASMTHLLHPKLKQLCYPRGRLSEINRLAKRAFGWIILVRAPNLNKLLRRRRLLSSSTLEKLGIFQSVDETIKNADDQGGYESIEPLAVVKMLMAGASLEAEANFLREAEVLVELQHKNIIQLLGVCIPLQPLSFLFEYLPFGDLNSFLHRYSPDLNYSAANGQLYSLSLQSTITSRDTCDLLPRKLDISILLNMALDSCDAMIYLSDNYYIHRDVATRSFFVGRKLIVKLSDFSMCRPVDPQVDFIANSNEMLPIKWLPLESILHGRFHVDTDVWSFGVFLWELFNFAMEPYADKDHAGIISSLEIGYRLPRPMQCPDAVYQIMLHCWSTERSQRPKFSHLRVMLKNLALNFQTNT